MISNHNVSKMSTYLPKSYLGPFKKKVYASSYDEAAVKILKKLNSHRFQNKHNIHRSWHRFRVENISTRKMKYYLVDDDEVRRCPSFEPTNLDYARKDYLERACEGIGIDSEKISPEIQGTITLSQARVVFLSEHSHSYRMWMDFVEKGSNVIFRGVSKSKVWINDGGENTVRIGINGVGYITLDEKEGLLSRVMVRKSPLDKKKIADEIEKALVAVKEKHKIKTELLKRKIKMLEKTVIKLELENEKLRWGGETPQETE